MSFNAGQIRITLGADVRDLQRGMDRATRELRDFNRDTDRVSADVRSSFGRVGRESGTMARNISQNSNRAASSLRAAFSRITQAAARMAAELRRINLDRLRAQLESVTRASTAFTRAMGVIGGAIAALGANSIRLAGEFEQTRIAFENLTGSAEAADSVIRRLIDFSTRTPFQLQGLQDATRLLITFGVEVNQAVDITETLADAVAAAGGGSAELEGVARAIGQIEARGKVAAEELLQLAERGIPAFEILQEQLGLTGEQVSNIGRLGIDSATAIDALTRGLAERFGGLAEQQSQTILGLFSTLRDNLTLLSVDVGEQLAEALNLSDVLNSAISQIRRFRDIVANLDISQTFENLRGTILQLLGALLAMSAPAVIAGLGRVVAIIARLGPLAIAGAVLVEVIQRLNINLGDFQTIARRIALALTALASIINNTIGLLATLVVAVIEAFGNFAEFFQELGDAFISVSQQFRRAFDAIREGDFGGAVDELREGLREFRFDVQQAFGTNFGEILERARQSATQNIDKIRGAVDALYDALTAPPEELEDAPFFQSFRDAGVGLVEQIQNEVSILEGRLDQAVNVDIPEARQDIEDFTREVTTAIPSAFDRAITAANERLVATARALELGIIAEEEFNERRLNALQGLQAAILALPEDQFSQFTRAIDAAEVVLQGSMVGLSELNAEIMRLQEVTADVDLGPIIEGLRSTEDIQAEFFNEMGMLPADAEAGAERLAELREELRQLSEAEIDLQIEPILPELDLRRGVLEGPGGFGLAVGEELRPIEIPAPEIIVTPPKPVPLPAPEVIVPEVRPITIPIMTEPIEPITVPLGVEPLEPIVIEPEILIPATEVRQRGIEVLVEPLKDIPIPEFAGHVVELTEEVAELLTGVEVFRGSVIELIPEIQVLTGAMARGPDRRIPRPEPRAEVAAGRNVIIPIPAVAVERILNPIQRAAEGFSRILGGALEGFARQINGVSALLDTMAAGHSVVSGLINMFTSLILATGPFQELLRIVNEALGAVAEALASLLLPVIKVVAGVIRIIGNIFIAIANVFRRIIGLEPLEPIRGFGEEEPEEEDVTPEPPSFEPFRLQPPDFRPAVALTVGQATLGPTVGATTLQAAEQMLTAGDMMVEGAADFSEAVDRFVSSVVSAPTGQTPTNANFARVGRGA